VIGERPAFAVPGYDLDTLLGVGGQAEVWSAQSLVDGAVVAVKRVYRGAAAIDTWRAEVAALTALADPALLPLRDVLTTGDDLILVTDLATGGSLAHVLAERGRLELGEIATVITPIAPLLSRLHSRHLVHGDICPANLLFTADGTPLLADFGVSRVIAAGSGSPVAATAAYADPSLEPGGEFGAAGDVFGLAAVVFHCLSGRPPWLADDDDACRALARADDRPPLVTLVPRVPPVVVDAVEQCLAADPGKRPGPAALTEALLSVAAPLPVVLVPPARPMRSLGVTSPLAGVVIRPATQPAAADRPKAGRWMLPAGVAAAAMLGASVTAGVAWGRGSATSPPSVTPLTALPASSGPIPPPRPPATRAAAQPPVSSRVARTADWRRIVTRLDTARTAAFSAGSPSALDRIYRKGCPALTADRAALQLLDSRGLRPADLRSSVGAVRLIRAAADAAVVTFVSSVSTYQLIDRSTMQTEAVVPAQPRRLLRATLRRGPGGRWRIARIRQA
jgi:hypothetical protein